MLRFRQACNKKFGDRQGKIKQGYVLAITEWCDKVLNSKSIPEPPDLLAKKLLEDSMKAEAHLDQDENIQTNSEESIEAKAKKLAEERRKEQVDQDEHKVLS